MLGSEARYCILDALRRVIAEVDELAADRAEATDLPEQPLESAQPFGGINCEEMAGLFSEVNEDRA